MVPGVGNEGGGKGFLSILSGTGGEKRTLIKGKVDYSSYSISRKGNDPLKGKTLLPKKKGKRGRAFLSRKGIGSGRKKFPFISFRYYREGGKKNKMAFVSKKKWEKEGKKGLVILILLSDGGGGKKTSIHLREGDLMFGFLGMSKKKRGGSEKCLRSGSVGEKGLFINPHFMRKKKESGGCFHIERWEEGKEGGKGNVPCSFVQERRGCLLYTAKGGTGKRKERRGTIIHIAFRKKKGEGRNFPPRRERNGKKKEKKKRGGPIPVRSVVLNREEGEGLLVSVVDIEGERRKCRIHHYPHPPHHRKKEK